jgi:hypothetical protein
MKKNSMKSFINLKKVKLIILLKNWLKERVRLENADILKEDHVLKL